jgi:urease accessory protein
MLQVFKSIPVVREAHRPGTVPSRAAQYRRDTITLGWEARSRTRARRRSDGGAEFGVALARGTFLREGDCLLVDELATLVVVVEEREPVLVVSPRTSVEWGLCGYFIGNTHQPVMIAEEGIVCLDEPATRLVLEQYALPFRCDRRPFIPVSLAGLDAGHRHAE